MPAGRKATALDHRDLVRHVGVRRIMRNGVDAGLGHDSPGLYSCALAVLQKAYLSTIQAVFRPGVIADRQDLTREGALQKAGTLRHHSV